MQIETRCGGCAERRAILGKAVAALRSGNAPQVAALTKTAAKSLSDDAKAFARGLQARLAKR